MQAPFPVDHELLERCRRAEAGSAIDEFFTLLAVCNGVVPTRKRDKATGVEMLHYESESPDEAALVLAARVYGYTLASRSHTTLMVRVHGVERTYQLLDVIEFDSTRKRMSVIVRRPDDTIRLYIKGADSAIQQLLAAEMTSASRALVTATMSHLEYYASEGLRTLSMAYRDLSETEYLLWHARYYEAQMTIEGRQEKLAAVAEQVEKALTLLGATGIEDKLQDGVPRAIAQLRAAGLRVWVLTGDKQETAINIGFSCRLLDEDMPQIIVNAMDKAETVRFLRDAMDRYMTPEARAVWARGDEDRTPHALIIDGQTLAFALEDDVRALLLELATFCHVVLCCRATPLQKARVVKMVKEGRGVMTLAIGDGANDVSMIQTADVGVGISGQEGMQAVRVAQRHPRRSAVAAHSCAPGAGHGERLCHCTVSISRATAPRARPLVVSPPGRHGFVLLLQERCVCLHAVLVHVLQRILGPGGGGPGEVAHTRPTAHRGRRACWARTLTPPAAAAPRSSI